MNSGGLQLDVMGTRALNKDVVFGFGGYTKAREGVVNGHISYG